MERIKWLTMIDFLNNLDTELFLTLNALHNHLWDFIMYNVSRTLIWTPLYMGIIFYAVKTYKKQSIIVIAFLILLVFLTDQVSVQLFKNVFHRLRPCHNPDISGMVHLVHGRCGGHYSFVSSHAANTFGMAVFTSMLFYRKWYTTLILCWALFVSYSRIYLGVHYPGDVLAGALLGGAIAVILLMVFVKFVERLKSRGTFFQ